MHPVFEFISKLSDQFWITLGGIVLLIVGQAFQIRIARLNAQLAKEAREESSTARVVINDKLDANTAITQEAAEVAKEVKNHLASIPQQRVATALARNGGDIAPEFYEIRLPGVDYEPFGWSTGSLVEWKSLPCEEGRKARFLVHGPAAMGFHFHKVVEVVFGMRGKLIYQSANEIVEINPGEYYRAEIDEVHSATFEESGEAEVHWPDQHTDTILIGIYPQS